MVNLQWSPFPRKSSPKILKKMGHSSEQNSGQNSDKKMDIFRELSFSNSYDLIDSHRMLFQF